MKFSFNSRIIRHLGYELITSDEVAITELIKNSYDARATAISIQFLSSFDKLDQSKIKQKIPNQLPEILNRISPNGMIVIEDDGKGMSQEDLRNAFFEIGTPNKKIEKEKDTGDTETIILGDKGIGRLAAQRISPVLIVESATQDSDVVNIVQIDWAKFIANKDFDAPEWLEERPLGNSYTRLWLIGSPEIPVEMARYYEEKEVFETEDIFGNPGKSLGFHLFIKDDLQAALSFLYSPFEQNRSIIKLNFSANGKPIRLEFNFEVLKLAESVHSFTSEIIINELGEPDDLLIMMEMQLRPWFIERIHQGELGKVLYQDWKRGHKEYDGLYKKYKEHYESNLQASYRLTELRDIWKKKGRKVPDNFVESILKVAPLEGEIHSFKRDLGLMSLAKKSANENGYIADISKIQDSIRPFLDANNGIKLYRNAFRIGTIGNRDDDWLKLQQKRTVGQQFYRFELGNVIGFITINDPKQEYIYETSSRQGLTQNLYVDAVRFALSELMEIFSPGFTKSAVDLTKRFLDLEGWLPENKESQIRDEVDKSKKILAAAKKNLHAIQAAVKAIKDHIDLDTDEKIRSVKEIFTKLEPVATDFEENLDDTERSFKSADQLLEVAKQEQIRIKTEAYNNYKLMANGMVTEIITHELHSLLSNSEREAQKYDEHISIVENYLLDNKQYKINNDHFSPVKRKFIGLYGRMGELSRFYSFLEKTFITKDGNRVLETTDVRSELATIVDRFGPRLKRHHVDVDFSAVNCIWDVPKGALLHVFYNLIDNSIYWILQRQKLGSTDQRYKKEERDRIVISNSNFDSIRIYDTGTGVLEKYQHTLFNELESGKEGGRGMGLYIVRQFLKSFGGTIELLPDKNEYGHRYIFEISMENYEDNE